MDGPYIEHWINETDEKKLGNLGGGGDGPQPPIGATVKHATDHCGKKSGSTVAVNHGPLWRWENVKNKNVTDTILWQGHHDRVMQLNWLYFCGICQMMPLKVWPNTALGCNHQSICMLQLQPLCSAALIPNVLQGMKARVSHVQWSKPYSILAPGGRIQNHKRWLLHYHCTPELYGPLSRWPSDNFGGEPDHCGAELRTTVAVDHGPLWRRTTVALNYGPLWWQPYNYQELLWHLETPKPL